MRTIRVLAAALAALGIARADGPPVDGEYESPLGRVRVSGRGAAFRGVLLASGERLAGAVHVATKGCKAPLGKKGGLAFVRVEATAKKAMPDSATRAKAREIMRDGAAWLGEGSFEAARRRFLEAIELDGGIPEAYNGVGVTYRMRDDLPRALDWYKKALTVDPDFGDAYYNIACVYALEGHKELALRYLQIAAMNGYATAEGIDGDPDLEAVRDEPAYRALVRAKM